MRKIRTKVMAVLIATFMFLGIFPVPAQAMSDTMVLSAEKSKQFNYFYMEAYGRAHGPLYLMSLNGNVAFCMDYGKHSPDGETYRKVNLADYVSEKELAVMKTGLLFALYMENGSSSWGSNGLHDLSITSGNYLMAQIWIWGARKGLSALECAETYRSMVIDWGPQNAGWADNIYWMAQDFINQNMGDMYDVEVYAYTSGDSANQNMFTYDFSTFRLREIDVGVGVHKTGVMSGEAKSGAVYGVYSDPGCTKEVASLTTGTDGRGSVTWKTKAAATFYLKEKVAPTGTELNPQVYSAFLGDGSAESITYVETSNREWNGRVRVTKKDAQTGQAVPGATFTLQEWNGGRYADKETLQDLGNGSYQSSQLYYTNGNQGRFQVKEAKAPDGYVNSNWSQEFRLTKGNQEFSYTVENDEIRGRIVLAKEDVETGSKAQGDATLEGAVYGLFAKETIQKPGGQGMAYAAGAEVARAVIHEGTASFNSLYLGSYEIRELGAPKGYTLSPKTYPVKLTAVDQKTKEVLVSQTVTDQVNKQPVSILKIGTDGSSGVVRPLDGAQFTIKLNSEVEKVGWERATAYAVLTTDAKGYAKSEPLPYGTYLIRETVTPSEFITAQDFLVEITENMPDTPKEYIINDAPFRAYIRFVKEDSVTGEIIPQAGVSFQLRDSEGKLVTYKVGNEIVDTLVTGEDGMAQTPLMNVAGTYTVTEITAPEGYVLLEEPVTITVSSVAYERDPEGDPVLVVHVENTPIRVDFTKSDITTGEPVLGARMQLLTKSEELVEEWVTEEEPHRIHALPAGEYILRETQAPTEQGYVKSLDIPFTVEETGEIQKVDMKDDYTKVLISKTDITTGKPVIGAHMQILAEDGNVLAEWVTEEDPYFIERLPVGNYILRETLAPTEQGYVKSQDILFTVRETGKIQLVEMEDDYTKVLISKTDITTGEPVIGAHMQILTEDGEVFAEWITEEVPYIIDHMPVGAYVLQEVGVPYGYLKADDIPFTVEENPEVKKITMEEEMPQGEIHIRKTDEKTGEVLAGAVFEVRDEEGTVVCTMTTDENGLAVSEPLLTFHKSETGEIVPYVYQVVEVQAPEGYQISGEVHEVSFVYADEKTSFLTVDLDLSNRTVTVTKDAPKTGDYSHGVFYVGLAILGLTGAVVLLFYRKKRK